MIMSMEGSPDNAGGNAYNEEIADKRKRALVLLPLVEASTSAYYPHHGTQDPSSQKIRSTISTLSTRVSVYPPMAKAFLVFKVLLDVGSFIPEEPEYDID